MIINIIKFFILKLNKKNKNYKELIIGTTVSKNIIALDPFQTIWLSN